jgi:hypothetical protein
MKETFKFRITDTTTPNDMDSFFYDVWSRNKNVYILLDTTSCKNVSLTRILSIKSVLNKHRNNSKKYIDHTTILVKSRLVKNILRVGLSILRTERPVYIETL